MTSKEYLSQAYRLKQRINLCKIELEELKELSTSISSPSLEPNYNASKSIHAPFEKAVLKMTEMKKEQETELNNLINLEIEINKAIDSVEDHTEKIILRYRYLCFLTWNEIATIMGYTVRTIYRKHKSALEHFTVPEDGKT